jgi:mRNA interferase RelE/StbE
MILYRIEFIPQAVEDYKRLDGSVRKKVDKKMEELSKDPFLGEFLGNKFNIDLTGFYKTYVDHKKIRIVYRLIDQEIEIVEIWGIGKREKEEIYRIIGERLKRKKTKCFIDPEKSRIKKT